MASVDKVTTAECQIRFRVRYRAVDKWATTCVNTRRVCYQHATADRDRAIAAFLDDQIKAEHHDERAPIMPLPDHAPTR